mmetsp:Transcript_14600/g.13194  ORF Transcript_14600/g.13194 Transcript_14600/m.13194 type:complete len:91 (+) Transcript_14600:2004-2276(+)
MYLSNSSMSSPLSVKNAAADGSICIHTCARCLSIRIYVLGSLEFHGALRKAPLMSNETRNPDTRVQILIKSTTDVMLTVVDDMSVYMFSV